MFGHVPRGDGLHESDAGTMPRDEVGQKRRMSNRRPETYEVIPSIACWRDPLRCCYRLLPTRKRYSAAPPFDTKAAQVL
jgi:hypothetical protein